MAPEVLQGSPLDPRTDLYSLGAVGYFCLTGRVAFPARDVSEAAAALAKPSRAALRRSPPDIPAELRSPDSVDVEPGPARTARDGGRRHRSADRDRPSAARATRSVPSKAIFFPVPSSARTTQIRLDPRAYRAGARRQRAGEVLIEGPGRESARRASPTSSVLAGYAEGARFTLRGRRGIDAHELRCRPSLSAAGSSKRVPEIRAARRRSPHAALLRKLAPELEDALGGADSVALMSDPAERRMRFSLRLAGLVFSQSVREADAARPPSTTCTPRTTDSAAFSRESRGAKGRGSHLFVLTTLRSWEAS